MIKKNSCVIINQEKLKSVICWIGKSTKNILHYFLSKKSKIEDGTECDVPDEIVSFEILSEIAPVVWIQTTKMCTTLFHRRVCELLVTTIL